MMHSSLVFGSYLKHHVALSSPVITESNLGFFYRFNDVFAIVPLCFYDVLNSTAILAHIFKKLFIWFRSNCDEILEGISILKSLKLDGAASFGGKIKVQFFPAHCIYNYNYMTIDFHITECFLTFKYDCTALKNLCAAPAIKYRVLVIVVRWFVAKDASKEKWTLTKGRVRGPRRWLKWKNLYM